MFINMVVTFLVIMFLMVYFLGDDPDAPPSPGSIESLKYACYDQYRSRCGENIPNARVGYIECMEQTVVPALRKAKHPNVGTITFRLAKEKKIYTALDAGRINRQQAKIALDEVRATYSGQIAPVQQQNLPGGGQVPKVSLGMSKDIIAAASTLGMRNIKQVLDCE